MHQEMILPLQIIFFDRGEITKKPDGIINRETRLAIERAEIEFSLMSPDGLPDSDVFLALVNSLEARPLKDETLLTSVPPMSFGTILREKASYSDIGCDPIPSFNDFEDGL